MNSILLVGIAVFVGFILGQEFQRFKLPKILGYLIAGVLFNPNVCSFVPKNITAETDIIEKIAIAFIAFSIGGSIVFSEIKKLGKGIAYITIFEAEVTFFVIFAGFMIVFPFFVHLPQGTWFSAFIPASLLLGCIGSPTDPSVALAVTHQYNAKGKVASTMLSVAAFDDVLGIINYSAAIVIARAIAAKETFSAYEALFTPLLIILGSLVLGCIMGLMFNLISLRLQKQTEGVIFVLILSFITLCWGLATYLHAEEILSVMVMAIIITNYNINRKKVFAMLERYSEELIFLIFFILCGLHLDFKMLTTTFSLLMFFVIFRIIGKFLGTAIGAGFAKSPPEVKKYTASGLIPFGGIVIGLALLMQQDPVFDKFSGFIVSTIVAATIINEFIGPIFVKAALKKAGEIK